jgi:Protein of unknown function (DUF2934)
MAKTKVPKKANGNAGITPVETAMGVPVVENPAQKNTKVGNSASKPVIVRAEPRANLVPINLDDEIRRLAYLLSERRGFAPGHETEDWLAAEREVRDRYHQQSA